jgi:hypothetical protein
MVFKPQDTVILLKCVTFGIQTWSYSPLAHELAVNPQRYMAATSVAVRNPGLMVGLPLADPSGQLAGMPR